MWALARAKPGMMATALANLERQQFVFYAPKIMEERIVRHRKVDVPVYLFSTYIFIQVQDRWLPLSYTYGLSKLVLGHENKPSQVPQKLIDDLMEREQGGFYQLMKPQSFHRGQMLYVKSGLLEGKFGVCQGMKGPDRVKVLFAGMKAEMAIHDLEAA